MEIQFKVNPDTNKLETIKRYLPSMKQRRIKHCSIVIRDHLFVFFGYQDNLQKFSDTIEFLYLKDKY